MADTPGINGISSDLPNSYASPSREIRELFADGPLSADSVSSRSVRIELGRAMLAHLPDGPERNKVLEYSALQQFEQYEALNDWEALESAIDYLWMALKDTEIKSDYARLCVTYATFLGRRYVRSTKSTDLDNALEYAEGAVGLIRGFKRDSTSLQLLVKAILEQWLLLWLKYELQNANSTDDSVMSQLVDRLMSLAVEAHELATVNMMGDSAVASAKTSLGKSYELKWSQKGPESGDFFDLTQAVDLGRQVVALTTLDDVQGRADALSNLSHRLQRAYLAFVRQGLIPPEVPDGAMILEESIDALTQSFDLYTDQLLSGPSNTLAFIHGLSDFPTHDRCSMLGRCEGILERSIVRLKQLWKVSSPTDRRDNISTFYGISRYAAAAVLENSTNTNTDTAVVRAIQLLESGRSLGVAAQFEELHELGAARAVNADLANQYAAARTALQEALQANAPHHERRQHLKHLEQLRADLNSTLEATSSLRTLSKANLQSLAEDRDIIIINITDVRSDAIVISNHRIFSVTLPEIDEYDLGERSWEIQTRLAKDNGQEEVFAELHEHLGGFFSFLWKKLARVVLHRLGYTKKITETSGHWPHVCWILTGVLCLYPIHAAGLGLHKDANVMNRVVSSYASSLTNLWYLRQRALSKTAQMSPVDATAGALGLTACIVSMPETPERADLEFSENEVEILKNAFPDAEVLVRQPTQAVLAGLAAEPAVLHVSCHGEVDYDFPLESKLLTSDWDTDPLTVGRLQLLDLRNALLAYLSACFTANAGVEHQQDENVHLANALQLAGFSNVVGAAWYVGEEASLAVVRRFYNRIRQSQPESDWSRRIAAALHFAVLDFRESTRKAANLNRGEPVSWAPFMLFTS